MYTTFISMAEAIGDHVLKARPHLETKVSNQFPSAMHYVRTLVDLVLEDDTLRMPAQNNPEQEAEREKAAIIREFPSYEGLLKALQEELKNTDHALNICIALEALMK
ncbi:hypothetical protein KI387_021250, partial [Taxus chinensis]